MVRVEVDLRKGLQEIWELLADDEQNELLRGAIYQGFRRGEFIYNVNDESSYLIVVLRGRVKLEKFGVGGRVQIVRMFRPCEFFGYRSFFAGEVHSSVAIAMEQTHVACVPMMVIENICQRNAALAMYFVRALAIDLGHSEQRQVNLTQKHMRGRIADSLVFLSDKYGFEGDDRTLNVQLSRDELASLSNMNTSNAIRTLAAFADEGIVELDGRRIKILDKQKLKRINITG